MYKIVITKITTETIVERGDYGVVDKRPYTKEELEETGAADHWRTQEKEVLDYRPDKEVCRKVSVDVLTQQVDQLDMSAVIKAINGLT